MIELEKMDYKIRHPNADIAYSKQAHQFLVESQIKPQFPLELIQRFFQRLISSDKNIVEVWLGDKKLACAVLVDQVTNSHASAHIEYLGFSNFKDLHKVLSYLFKHFESITRARGKHTGLVATHHKSLPFSQQFLIEQGYTPIYKIYELICKQVQPFVSNLSPEFQLERLQEDDFPEYYEVLKKSFENNPDTSIGTMHDLWIGFRKQTLPTFVVKHEKRIVGFITINFDYAANIGEINTLGVLPHFRQKGIGRYLLAIAADHLWQQNVGSLKLSVALENLKALKLYQNAGFEMAEEFTAFRKVI